MFASTVQKLSGHKTVVSLSFLFFFTFLVGICSAKTMATSNSVEKVNNDNELEPRVMAQYRSSDSAPVGFIPSLGAGPFYDEDQIVFKRVPHPYGWGQGRLRSFHSMGADFDSVSNHRAPMLSYSPRFSGRRSSMRNMYGYGQQRPSIFF